MSEPRPVVVVVDDEPDVRELVRDILQSAGFDALAAGDGQEALELMTRLSRRVDLVLTDVMMPQMDGPTLARRLAESPSPPPVLFMTGYTADALASRGLLARDVPRVEKPFRMRDLVRQVREALER